MPLRGPIAPEQSPDLLKAGSTTAPLGPDIIVSRPAVGPIADVPSFDTFSAGTEIPIPRTFDVPAPLRNIYGRLTGGMRTTLLAPELQSEIDITGQNNVMMPRGMTPPYVVRDAGPWYESFLKTYG